MKVPAAAADEYDFGKILVRDQMVLEHQFDLKNESGDVLRVLGAISDRPCCSVIGHLPQSISPGETAKLPFAIRPGNQFGRRSISFAVRTDEPVRPIRTYTLVANLLPEFEVWGDETNPKTIPVGSAGKLRLTVICRRSSSEGLALPDSIGATGPISCRFVGEASESTVAEGVIESTRVVEVDIGADSQAGARRGEVVFRWASGTERSRTIAWQVTPRVVAQPSGIIIEPSSGVQKRSVLVVATDRTFRIVRISAPFLTDSSCPGGSEPRRSHRADLAIDPARLAGGTAGEVRIETDHPDQPVVALSVLVLPNRERGVSP